jgi:hypothetical protein
VFWGYGKYSIRKVYIFFNIFNLFVAERQQNNKLNLSNCEFSNTGVRGIINTVEKIYIH